MKKIMFFMVALCATVVMNAAEALSYTLTPAKGSNNAYAKNCDVEIDGITWNVTGNSTMLPWRIGGKKLTNEDRTVYSKTAIADNISKIVVTHGTASLTVNSVKLIVSTEENGGGTIISTVDGGTFAASSDMTFARPADADWTGRFYKFVYNVTVGSSNNYVEFSKALFYKEVSEIPATGITLTEGAEMSMELYREAQLHATLAPEGANTTIEWSSSDDTSVTVSDKGYLTVKSLNSSSVTITAKAGEGVQTSITVNLSEPTVLTCVDAAEKALSVSANNELYEGGRYVIQGYVTEILTTEENFANYGNINMWIADTEDGGQVFQCYYCVPEDGEYPTVGDKIEAIGYLTKYNTTPETGKVGSSFKVLVYAGLEKVEATNRIFAIDGKINAPAEARIFNLIGMDVTHMNGQLENGIFLVKVGKNVTKVLVKK